MATLTTRTAAVAKTSPPWATAAVLLAAAMIFVIACIAAVHADGHLFGAPPTIELAGNVFTPVRGTAHRAGVALIVDALDADRLAVMSARLTPFRADAYPRVAIRLRLADVTAPTPADVPGDMTLLWRTVERPNRNFSKPLTWTGPTPAPFDLTAADGWSGSITGVALAIRGQLPRPLTIDSVSIEGRSALTAIGDIARQWSLVVPFGLTSITAPFEYEHGQIAPLLVTVAAACLLAALAYRWRQRRATLDWRVLSALFVGAWLLLDARWQIDLWRQLAETYGRYAGKTDAQKHMAAADFEVYALMQEVNEALPAPPVRIHFLADSLALRTRGAFFLYPHNVFHGLGDKVRLPKPDELRSGDYVLSLLYTGLTYDRSQPSLVWPDGRRKPVDEILFKPGGPLLVRIK